MTNLRLEMDVYEIEEDEIEEIEGVWFTKKERFLVLKEIQDSILSKHFWADGHIAQIVVSETKGYISFDDLPEDLEDEDHSIQNCIKEHIELLSVPSRTMVERVISEGMLNDFLDELLECYVVRGMVSNAYRMEDFR